MYRPTTRRRKYIRRRRIIRKRKVPATIKSYVKKQIHRNIENKEKMNYASNLSIQTGDVATTTYPLLMNIIQGSQNDQRVGNQIRTVKGVWKGVFNLLPYDAVTNPNAQPTWVKIWVVKDLKNNGQLSTMDNTSYLNFFRINNSGLGFQSNPLDTCLEINNDYFRVLYQRTFKLGAASAFNAGIPTNANSYFDNSPFAKQITINWGKWNKKQLKFNDNTGYCINDNMYLVVQPVTADGTSALGKRLVEMHYTNYQHFEDA